MTEVRKYRKKPVVVHAFQWTPGCELPDWAVDNVILHREFVFISVGSMTADPGDYIIRGAEGEVYPCKPSLFEKTYDPVTEP